MYDCFLSVQFCKYMFFINKMEEKSEKNRIFALGFGSWKTMKRELGCKSRTVPLL